MNTHPARIAAAVRAVLAALAVASSVVAPARAQQLSFAQCVNGFQVARTVLFTDGGNFNGPAPNPAPVLGTAFDPEGFVVNPASNLVYAIDLAGATDVSNVAIANGVLPAGVTPISKSASPAIDLAANTLDALGNNAPEKIEGLAIGPRLDDGRYLVLAGTDNDYSVTQNAAGAQYDVYFDFTQADPYASSIQCPVGQTTSCVAPSATVPEPAPLALTALGLGAGLAAAVRRARS